MKRALVLLTMAVWIVSCALPTIDMGGRFTLETLITVNGFEREVRWDVSADRSGRDLNVRARTAFKFGLFGMEPPRRGPVLSIVDEIRLDIELAAKSRV